MDILTQKTNLCHYLHMYFPQILTVSSKVVSLTCKFGMLRLAIITASQTWCMIRLLPLMIGDLIPSEDPYWDNYLRLISIVDYVCAPETTIDIAGHLRTLIAVHHSNFKMLYPHRLLTPKFHHMVHIPKWIVE